MATARGIWDSSKHFRGYHGRFSGGGDRSGAGQGRAAAAFHPRRSAAEARAQVGRQTDAARDVHAAYYMRELNGGRVDRAHAALTEYQAPKRRQQAIAATGSAVMPTREALRQQVGLVRKVQRDRAGTAAPRVAVGRTFTGRKRVVRGYSAPSGAKPLTGARRGA